MTRVTLSSAFTFTLCLSALSFAACDSGPAAEPRISPDTARRELFLRNYSYREDVFLTCAKDGEAVCVRLFALAGMSTEVRNEEGETPLMLAARGNHAKAARELLKSGADVNAASRIGVT